MTDRAIGEQRWTRIREDGATETAVIPIVTDMFGKPAVLVDVDFIGDLMAMGGFQRTET